MGKMSMNKALTHQDVTEVFRQWQAYSDLVDELKPQAWEATDEDTLKQISERITSAALARYDLLNDDPDFKQALETYFSDFDYGENDPVLREYYRCFTHTAYVERGDLEAFYAQAPKMQNVFDKSMRLARAEGKPQAWKYIKDHLKKIFDLRRSMAVPVAKIMNIQPSEVTLDYWNPYSRIDDINRVIKDFERLKPLVKKFYKLTNTPDFLPVTIDDKHQSKIAAMFESVRTEILNQAGWHQSRLEQAGITISPITFTSGFSYCWGSPKNIRMGFDYENDNLPLSFSNFIHETGHLIYMLSRNDMPRKLRGTPAGHINGYSVHEAAAIALEQSSYDQVIVRLFAKAVHNSLPEIVKDENGQIKPEWTEENLTKVFAYQNPHPTDDTLGTDWCDNEIVMIPNMLWRIATERDILDGKMTVDDIPPYWASFMTEWTGINHRPEDFALTENHWLDDNAGYFYGYIFGAITAASMRHEIADKQSAESARRSLAATFEDKSFSNTQKLARFFIPHMQTLDHRIMAKAGIENPEDLLKDIEKENKVNPIEAYIAYCNGLLVMSGQMPEERG